jgi:ABC-type glycerol-3-phosphate transport system substrate-binding protein
MKRYACAFLLLAALAGCAPAASGSPLAAGQTVILWHSAEGEMRRALLDQVDTFNATNAWGVLVVPEYHGAQTALAAALDSAITAGHTPDLVLGHPLDVPRLGDAVIPVERYVTDPDYGLADNDLSDLYPAALDANRDLQRDGELMSFPVGIEGTVLIYNADRLAAAGYLAPPSSWPLFREVCLVTTIDRNGDRQPDVFGLGFAPRPEFVSAWFLSRGAPLLTSDGSAPGFKGDAGAKMLEVLAESAQGGCFYRVPGARADLDAFSTGRVAMIFASTSDLPDIRAAVEQQGGFRWGVAPVPYGQLPETLDISGPSWIILRSTPEKQLAAWLFARWFASTEQTAAWAHQTGQLPLRESAAERLKDQSADNPPYAAAIDLLRFAHADPLVAYWPAVAEAATRAVLSVAAGEPAASVHAQTLEAVDRLIP